MGDSHRATSSAASWLMAVESDSELVVASDPQGPPAVIVVGDRLGRHRRLIPAGARELAQEQQCDPGWEEQDPGFVTALIRAPCQAEGPDLSAWDSVKWTSSLAVLVRHSRQKSPSPPDTTCSELRTS